MAQLTLQGKYNTATIYTHNIEEAAIGQVIGMLNEVITENTTVAIIPDVHAGKGSTIGTTIKLPENRKDWKVCPNVVSVDIGCSMRAVKLKEQNVNLEKLDNIINELIPAGQNIYDKAQADTKRLYKLLENLSFPLEGEKLDRVIRSCGTLGGGNHYVELGTDSNNQHWLTVHTGSRALGVIVATHHQKIAEGLLSENKKINQEIIDYLTQNGRTAEIQAALNSHNKNNVIPNYVKTKKRPVINPDLAYLDGKELDDYLNDIKIAQEYSTISRQLILKRICDAMNFTVVYEFESMHNYIDIDNGIIRKGATSAQNGERLIIPINMRDGSIFATGKGNPDWNFSAPHGAGRILSRSKAKEQLSLDDYKETMSGIYTTSIGESTLDEAPFAYKPIDEILDAITDTVTVDEIVKPIYITSRLTKRLTIWLVFFFYS